MNDSKNNARLNAVSLQAKQGLIKTIRRLPSVSLRRVAVIMMLAIGFALAQGASISLLLPVLNLLEDADSAGGSGILWKITDWVISGIGLPYTLPAMSAAVLTMVLLAQVLNYGHHYMAVRTAEGFGANLRYEVFRALMHADIQFHYSHRPGDFLSALNQEANRAAGALMAIMELVVRSLVMTMYVALLVLISWETSMIAIGAIILVSLISQLWLRGSSATGRSMTGLWERVLGFGPERIHAVREVKLSGREKIESDQFKSLVDRLAVVSARLAYRMTQIRLVVEPALIGTGLLIIYAGTEFFDLALVEVGVLIYALIRITPEARALNNARYQIAAHLGSMRGLFNLIEDAQQRSEVMEVGLDAISAERRPLHGLSKSIVCEKVSFSYESGFRVLTDIDLAVEVGRTTAIVGPSGAGKSTVLALLVRLLTPTSGQILIDGTNIEEFDLASLRRGVALVSQDAALFNETVRENIRLGRPEATHEEVETVARLANADGFIRELSHGYETYVGDRGVMLSTGQRQRIALARALLLDPSVLLLDEITSAQDPESEKAIQEAIWRAKSGRTVLIVTHRLSSIQGVDRVLVLENGQIVEDGAPEDLLQSNGLFRHYYDIQIGSGWEQSPAERQ